jgi:hypothetical protein
MLDRIIVFDGSGKKVTVAKSDAAGKFSADLRPGTYGVRVKVTDHVLMPFVEVKIQAGEKNGRTLFVDAPAELFVSTLSTTEGPLPAKVESSDHSIKIFPAFSRQDPAILPRPAVP